MHLTLLAAGSRGDIQPFVALGVALKMAGYTVRLTASENFKAFVEGYGLEVHSLAGDVTGVASNPAIRDALQADNPLKVIRSFNVLKRYAFEMQKDLYAACEGAAAVIYHPGVSVGYVAAQAAGIPSILATPFPMTPTKDYPALVFYRSRFGKSANRLSHKLFEQIMWRTSKGPVKQFWQQTFGGLPEAFTNPFPKQQTAAQPTLVACSEHVFPHPADWPEHVYTTGYWFLEPKRDWKPPRTLQAFLEQGPPPVYAGFGSVSDPTTAAKTTACVLEALERSGQRGILASGWQGMTRPESLPEHVYMLESAPHSWLFPQTAAVIHHGGAGTTAAGFRAGVPSIIVPHSVDQFAWGARAYELGVGVKPIPKKKLDAERLARAISEALAPEVKSAAAFLGQKIRAENGLAVATELIARALAESGM